MNVTTRAFKSCGVKPPRDPELNTTKAMIRAAYHAWHVRCFGCEPQDFSMDAAIRRDGDVAMQLRAGNE